MTEKMFTPGKHVRYDKMGGVTDPCFHNGLVKLIDELGYSGTSLLEEGIKTAMMRHGLLKYSAEPIAAHTDHKVVPMELRVGYRDGESVITTTEF